MSLRALQKTASGCTCSKQDRRRCRPGTKRHPEEKDARHGGQSCIDSIHNDSALFPRDATASGTAITTHIPDLHIVCTYLNVATSSMQLERLAACEVHVMHSRFCSPQSLHHPSTPCSWPALVDSLPTGCSALLSPGRDQHFSVHVLACLRGSRGPSAEISNPHLNHVCRAAGLSRNS